MRKPALILGLLALGIAWSGLPGYFAPPFTAHMTTHMGVVALAAPLIAIGISGTRLDPSPRVPLLFAPLTASLLEFVAVWGWHAPALHGYARASAAGLALEQSSFIAVGLVLWLSCIGAQERNIAAGVLGFLFTSMHMTLLGALLALGLRPLYAHHHPIPVLGWSALEDQNLGGVVMLAAGGAAYLIGGLALMVRVLNAAPGRAHASGAE
jgi:putative membrane protein